MIKTDQIETSYEEGPSKKPLTNVLEKFAQFSPDFMEFGRGVNIEEERDFSSWFHH